MRPLLAVTSILAASTLTAGDSMRVDGVPVHGRVHDVSVADIHEAIARHGPDKALELEVISSREMHAYYGSHEQGWTRVRLFPSVPLHNGRHVIWDDDRLRLEVPGILDLIRTANEVYVFPVRTPVEDPHPDYRRRRLLNTDARENIVRLLGDKRNWDQGGGSLTIIKGGKSPSDIGLLFRRGKNELVLLYLDSWVIGTFNGEHVNGILEHEKQLKLLEVWKHHYAQPELAAE